MTFTVSGLSPKPFQPLYGLADDELVAQGARRVIADASGGYPDRIALRDAREGEAVILVNYTHQPADTPFHASHAVYVLEGARNAARFENEMPPMMLRRLLSLRGFDADHMLIDAEVTPGTEAAAEVERMLANAKVAYIHAHYARPGCYAALIERV
jgi:hypothetical protein